MIFNSRVVSFIVLLLMIIVIPLDAYAEKSSDADDPIFTQRLKNHYGAPVPVDVARTVSLAAVAEAKKNGWTIAVAVVDPGGVLVYFERMDGTQTASSDLAIRKARTAAGYKRSTKLLEDRIVQGRLQYLSQTEALPIEGGFPLIMDDKIVGAVAVSGARSEQDGVCAIAAVKALRQLLRETKK